MTGPDTRHYDSRASLAVAVAEHLSERLQARIASTGRVTMAVSGGTTPGPMLRRLGQRRLDWSKVVVTLTDERQVPLSSPRSNARLVSETLLQGAARSAVFIPLHGNDADPGVRLVSVCERLSRVALPLDIAVLGMGTDMHTASLFPGSHSLADALAPEAPPAIAIAAPGANEHRVTLSAPVLARAERHILIHGACKHDALRRAIEIADPHEAPVCTVLSGATVHYAD